jgi:hypothetical protein
MPVHLSVKPIKCEIHEAYLYNLDMTKERWLKGKIIGITSYPGDSLTLHVVVEET